MLNESTSIIILLKFIMRLLELSMFQFQVKKKNPIPSVHVLWEFLLSSAEFLWVVFTFIGQMDPVIIHYDGTCPTGPKSLHLLGREAPGAMSRACNSHF